MADYDNTNRGSLFKNDKGDNEKRPDYTGAINVNGVDFKLSAWIKESKEGKKYMSLSVQAKEDAPAPSKPVAKGKDAFDDSELIPF